MPNRRLGRLERHFFENRGVKRAPADRLAVGNQPILGPQRTTVRLGNRKNRIRISSRLELRAITEAIHQFYTNPGRGQVPQTRPKSP
jgi:hypothetical protein